MLLLQKCPLPLVEKPSILDEKEKFVFLMPFFSLSQWIIWKIEEWQSFSTRREGKENQHPSNTLPAPHEYQGKSRDTMCCQLLGSPPLASSPAVPSLSGNVRWDFREPCPWGVRQQGWHSQDKMSRCMEQGHKHKKKKRKGKKKKKPMCACTQINKKCNASFLN